MIRNSMEHQADSQSFSRITLPDVEIQHSLVFDVTQKRINDGFGYRMTLRE